jgi:glucose-6-phosphate 1-epimerase
MLAPREGNTMASGRARVEKGSGNLDRLVITAAEGEAHVYLHGAHVTHFQSRGGRPALFLSEKSHFVDGEPGKAIRGGVPICFPWFGANAAEPSAPAHGFARLLAWRCGDVVDEPGGDVVATLHLEPNAYTRTLFAHDFEATLRVRVGAQLTLDLGVRNTGAAPFAIEEALHSYFAVGDAQRVSITGLETAAYFDKTDGAARKAPEGQPITITRETDRVYPHASGRVTIEDPVWERRIHVDKVGSASTVVWNPWVDKARAMADFGDDEWRRMACVETANVGSDAVTVAPGATQALRATITVESLAP